MNLPIELVIDIIKYLDYKTQIRLYFPMSAPESIISEHYIWMDAAMEDNLNMIKFLHNNKIDGCTEFVMDGAARNGHLHIVKWLHKNRTEGCTLDVLFHGSPEIINWIIKNNVKMSLTHNPISHRFIIFDEPDPEPINISTEQLGMFTGGDARHFYI
jgi:hypothetical protein